MDEYKKLISANIKKYRLLAGLSQTALAEKLSVSSAAVSNWEKGQNSIDIDMLFKLCKILGVSVSDMGRKDPKDIVLSDEETKIILSYRELGEGQKDLVCQMLGVKRKDAAILDA